MNEMCCGFCGFGPIVWRGYDAETDEELYSCMMCHSALTPEDISYEDQFPYDEVYGNE